MSTSPCWIKSWAKETNSRTTIQGMTKRGWGGVGRGEEGRREGGEESDKCYFAFFHSCLSWLMLHFFFLLCINSGDGTLGASVAHKQARLYSWAGCAPEWTADSKGEIKRWFCLWERRAGTDLMIIHFNCPPFHFINTENETMKSEKTLQSREGTKSLRIPQSAININIIASLITYFITLWWAKETFSSTERKRGPGLKLRLRI